MKNEKLKTDSDIMVYLRNIRRALAELAEQTGQPIKVNAVPEGYAYAVIGEYEALQYEDGHEKYEYRPDDACRWEKIGLGQANFAGEPKEKPLAPGSNQGQRNNISHPYYKGESGGNQDE